ncbi:SAM-dependent methyltransferase [Streptomonospora salina]|uniref:SAM-dependent methyltransferase n=1 Tax=Streptomonospora salina TaxID=104205 RepID=UPI0035F01A90
MTDHWRAVHIDDDRPVAEVPDQRVVHIGRRRGRSSAQPARTPGDPDGSDEAGASGDPGAAHPYASVPTQVGGSRIEARRGFLRRAVGYLAADAGVRQFVDLGSRLPAGAGIGRAAREYAPGSRVVYVDAESSAALPAARAGDADTSAAVLPVERMDPDTLIDRIAGCGLVDVAEPLGVLLTDTTALRRDGVLIQDLVRALHPRLGPGGHIAVAQPVPDARDPHCREFAAAAFDPFTLIEPGLADIAWWPYPDEEVSGEPTGVLAGLGRRG